MVELRIKAAHGWRHGNRNGIDYRADYYAIGNPNLFGLFAAIVAENGELPNIGIDTAPSLLPEDGPKTVVGYADYWVTVLGGPDPEDAGGELLDETGVLVLAACHPDWYSGADLRHLLSVAEDRCRQSEDDGDLETARDDLREFVSAVYGEGGGDHDSPRP